MPKKKTSGRAIAPAKTKPNLPALPERFAIADTEIRPEQLYRIPDRHPRGAGPWESEPDKLAWHDAASGLDCIILRQASGVLAGYVGIDPEHPLWGHEVGAVPAAIRTTPHGGIDYAATCSHYGPEEVRVCHVTTAVMRRRPGRIAPHVAPDDQRWWLGFSCDKAGDLVPRGQRPDRAREEGEVYRDLAYVYHETVALARSLAALAEGSAVGASNQASLGAPLPGLGKPQGGDHD